MVEQRKVYINQCFFKFGGIAVYNFKVIKKDLESETILESKTISSIADFAQELKDIQTANEARFSFEPPHVFFDLERFWLIKTSKMKGFLKKRLVFTYYLELNFKYPDGKSGLCGYTTHSFDDVESMITNLINHQKLPDISSWIMTKWDTDGKGLSFAESNPNWKG